jgi:hypothetical protein
MKRGAWVGLIKGMASVKLTWGGDDLASADWHMASLDDV